MSDWTGDGNSKSAHDEEVARFNRWAEDYDNSFLQRLFFVALHQFTLGQATVGRSPTASILDVGCGTGRLLRQAAQRFPAAQLTGIDAAEEMILVARAAAPRAALLRFVQGFAEELPFADHSFDVVVSTLSFHHWSDQRMGLREVHRILSPGGTFALVDALAVGLLSRPLTRSHHGRFHRPEDLQAMLQGAGFDVERFVPIRRFGGVVQVILSHPVPGAALYRERARREIESSPERVPQP